ncbi:MAG: hypothetical protein E7300_10435 [Lachnospiraceae bacterium]|nr:hypothetical protein [Lachnospiraceae bacterium]
MAENSKHKQTRLGEILEFLKDHCIEAKDWAIANKKISIPVVAVVIVALLSVVALLSGRDDETALEETQAVDGIETMKVPEVPLEENAHPEVNALMEKYYAALADGDTETLASLKNYLSDTERIRVEKKSQYIEKYENIVCYTKVGLEENSYLVYAYNEAKFNGIDTPAPALNTFVVKQNEQGSFYIYEGDLDDNTFNYLQELSAQDDVTHLCNTVQAKYNDAIASDEKLSKFMDDFSQMIKEEVATALAELEVKEDTPASEETGDGEQKTDEPKVAVTEVEATATVNVRASDSEKADKLGKVAQGTRLPLLEKRANGWSKVTFEGKDAFIKSEFLADVVNVVEGDNANTAAPAENKPAESKPAETKPSNGGMVGSDGKVTAKTTVNVRAKASETADKLGVLYKGDKVELIMQQADGWCKIKYSGKTGFVKTDYVE